jgi:hypothetical protein
MDSISIIILGLIGILFAILILDRLVKSAQKHHDARVEEIQELGKLHRSAMRKIQELRDEDIRSLYPIGRLIPPRKDYFGETDDSGPR